MKLGDIARVTALLSRLSRPPSAKPDARVTEQRDLRGTDGTLYDLYRPAKGRTVRGVVLALHGLTRSGQRDARLVHFARQLAVSGVICATPRLPGLAACRFWGSDIDALVDVIDAVAQQTGQRCGVIGFSCGGSYALVAAADPRVAERVRFVLSFGAYHSLRTLFEGFLAESERVPANEAEWDEHIFLRLVIADQHGEELGLSSELRSAIDDLLGRYCHDSSRDEKHAFYQRELVGLDLLPLGLARLTPETLAALSPAGRLEGLQGTVSLIHDTADPLIPPAQAEALHAELKVLPDPERFHLLITPLVSHVDLGNLLRFGELRRFYSVLSPVLQSDA